MSVHNAMGFGLSTQHCVKGEGVYILIGVTEK